MVKFNDTDNNLIWVNYHEISADNPNFFSYIKSRILNKNNNPTTLSHTDAIATLNNWSKIDTSGNIRRFITLTSPLPIGNYLENKYFNQDSPHFTKDNTSQFRQYFAYKNIDNKPTLVGTALINHCKRFTYQDYLEYLIVNPNYQKQGIGTSMLKSIIDNAKYFTQSDNPENIVVYIHKDNIPSIKLIQKIGFEIFAEDNPFEHTEYKQTKHKAYIYSILKNEKKQTNEKEVIL